MLKLFYASIFFLLCSCFPPRSAIDWNPHTGDVLKAPEVTLERVRIMCETNLFMKDIHIIDSETLLGTDPLTNMKIIVMVRPGPGLVQFVTYIETGPRPLCEILNFCNEINYKKLLVRFSYIQEGDSISYYCADYDFYYTYGLNKQSFFYTYNKFILIVQSAISEYRQMFSPF
jgi:hypothetical protein